MKIYSNCNFKIGDELIFKSKITTAGIFKHDKKYIIKNILSNHYINQYNTLDIHTKISYVINEYYFSEEFVIKNFYSKTEIRKIKLEKINQNEN